MTGFVWITVRAGDTTTELAVPADLPLAEVLPDLARAAGLLDAATACRGHRVEDERGVVLLVDSSLRKQGVVDGAVLQLRPGLRDPPRPAYDDVLPAARPSRLRRAWIRWTTAASVRE